MAPLPIIDPRIPALPFSVIIPDTQGLRAWALQTTPRTRSGLTQFFTMGADAGIFCCTGYRKIREEFRTTETISSLTSSLSLCGFSVR